MCVGAGVVVAQKTPAAVAYRGAVVQWCSGDSTGMWLLDCNGLDFFDHVIAGESGGSFGVECFEVGFVAGASVVEYEFVAHEVGEGFGEGFGV